MSAPCQEIESAVRLSNDRLVAAGKPVLFLDRDGVIVEEVHYLRRVEDVRLIPGVANVIRTIRAAGIGIVVVTNQAGIARGLFGWTDYHAVSERMEALLKAEGATLDAIIACPFHPDFTEGYSEQHAAWRKPGGAMIRWAADRFGTDLSRSWLVGDNATDIEAAKVAGLAGAVHVLTGHGRRDRAEIAALNGPTFHVVARDDLSHGGPFLKAKLTIRKP